MCRFPPSCSHLLYPPCLPLLLLLFDLLIPPLTPAPPLHTHVAHAPRWLLPAAPDAKRAAVPCRMAMADLERAIAAEVEAEGTEAAAQVRVCVFV